MSRFQQSMVVLVILEAALGSRPLWAEGNVDEATARHLPWSGYWWPIAKGELLVPLSKYDYLTESQATLWERGHHPPGSQVPGWYGYCHAWSAASVLEFEPRTPRWIPGVNGSQTVLLGVGDQKGLLSACHTRDVANTYGQRYTGLPSQDPDDIYPDYLWQVLRWHIKEQGMPIVCDLDPGPEVWNYPVYAYRVEHHPGPDGLELGRMNILAVDDAVPPDYLGIMIHAQTYTFTFRMHAGSVVMGTGRWVGQSKKNHPDFCWYPYVVRAENPQLHLATLKQLIGDGQPSTGASAHAGNATQDRPPGTQPSAIEPSGTTAATPVADGSHGPPGIVLSPLEMLAAIAERTSSFGLDVSVDRFDGGRYAVGDTLTLAGSSERPGYLYLFYIDSQGGLSVLCPRPDEDFRVSAGRRFVFPPPQTGALRLHGPFGVHRIKAVVVDRPIGLTGLIWPADAVDKSLDMPVGRFHWNPTLTSQVRELLQHSQELSKDLLDGTDVRNRVQAFAQDEVKFYVGPPAEGSR